jgi:hypothetical protein
VAASAQRGQFSVAGGGGSLSGDLSSVVVWCGLVEVRVCSDINSVTGIREVYWLLKLSNFIFHWTFRVLFAMVGTVITSQGWKVVGADVLRLLGLRYIKGKLYQLSHFGDRLK